MRGERKGCKDTRTDVAAVAGLGLLPLHYSCPWSEGVSVLNAPFARPLTALRRADRDGRAGTLPRLVLRGRARGGSGGCGPRSEAGGASAVSLSRCDGAGQKASGCRGDERRLSQRGSVLQVFLSTVPESTQRRSHPAPGRLDATVRLSALRRKSALPVEKNLPRGIKQTPRCLRPSCHDAYESLCVNASALQAGLCGLPHFHLLTGGCLGGSIQHHRVLTCAWGILVLLTDKQLLFVRTTKTTHAYGKAKRQDNWKRAS
ncbi:uncharacterized protein LOC110399676 [Numida meleagris]|uniref:uncharacterized protein LOC110399676 n=1 Tax=Numida meleagris TaxID=8996 RepID=UPI000B3E0343|nr:uncharacterized protein LOC110399676 [Numida meleagris]